MNSLKKDVEKAVVAEKRLTNLSDEQLEAIQRTLQTDAVEVEIRLGVSTKLGIPGKHHGATTMPALQAATGRTKIDVKRIGDGDR